MCGIYTFVQELESGRELIRNVSSERARLSDKLEQLQAAYAQVKQDHDNKLRDLKVRAEDGLLSCCDFCTHQACVCVCVVCDRSGYGGGLPAVAA